MRYRSAGRAEQGGGPRRGGRSASARPSALELFKTLAGDRRLRRCCRPSSTASAPAAAAPRVVRMHHTADTSFLGLSAARLSGSGVGIGLQAKGTAVIHQADRLPHHNLELFSNAPITTLDHYRRLGANAAAYALGRGSRSRSSCRRAARRWARASTPRWRCSMPSRPASASRAPSAGGDRGGVRGHDASPQAPPASPTTRSPRRGPRAVRALSGKPMSAITLDAVLAGSVDHGRPPHRRAARFAPRPQSPGRRPPDARPQFRARRRPRRRAAGGDHARLRPAPPGPGADQGAELLAGRDTADDHGAGTIAAFVEEAAEVYERRGLFSFRF